MSMYKKIIGVIGTPRSGVSWTGQIFDSCLETLFRMQPFYSWAFRDKVHPRTTSEDFYKFFDELYLSNDDYILQLERRSEGIYPVFDKKEGPVITGTFAGLAILSITPVLEAAVLSVGI